MFEKVTSLFRREQLPPTTEKDPRKEELDRTLRDIQMRLEFTTSCRLAEYEMFLKSCGVNRS